MYKNYIYSFLIGITAGAIPAWYFAKKKYERIAQEEIDSVKEEFRKREHAADERVHELESRSDDDILAYKRNAPRVDYTRFSKDPPEEVLAEVGSPEMPPEQKPYVIPPEDFGWADYETVTLTYYKDGTLADDNDEPVENADDIVGDYSSHFGEYDPDVVYVRNELRKCDYEIIRDEREYGEILDENPLLAQTLDAMMDVDDS